MKTRGRAVEPLAIRGPRDYAAGGRRRHGAPNAILERVAGRPKKLVLHVPPKSRAPDTLDVVKSSGEGRPRHRGPPPPKGDVHLALEFLQGGGPKRVHDRL